MSHRYFYDCPIKALYMIKEFGVKLKVSGAMGKFNYNTFPDFIPWELCNCPQIYSDLIKHYAGNIYVCEESEAIFQPKEGDLGIDKEWGTFICNQHGLWNRPGLTGLKNQELENIQIIMRDNKQFFMPLKSYE